MKTEEHGRDSAQDVRKMGCVLVAGGKTFQAERDDACDQHTNDSMT